MGHESQIELWSPFDRRSGLLVSELTGFVAIKQWKKHRKGLIAGRLQRMVEQRGLEPFKAAAEGLIGTIYNNSR
jgi:hypothetical protein